jgi:2-polyprenyl-3-methyl-5-hydroxy-6-metoxy-1,4-benzoquinol methylase
VNRKENTHEGGVLISKNNYDVILCDKCEYAHIMPLPTMEDVNEFYGKDYYETIKPEMLSNYEKSLDWFNQMYDDRFEIFEENTSMPGRVLDIGAGAGYFLKRAKERNWQYVGVEASRAACKYAEEYNKVTIINDFVENISVSEVGQFDAINISEVLEHVINPVGILEKCYKLLKDDGILFVMVPNEFNPLQLANNEINPESSNYWVVPDHHYNYFNFDSISSVLGKAKFKSFKTEVSFPMEYLLLSGVNYVEDREKGKITHDYVKKLELNLVNNGFRSLKRELYESIAKIGVGRDIMVYSKKVVD